jgi:osmotically-inducible protein OsmY
MDDKPLRLRVVAELDWEPGLDAANIGVAVEGGVVTLTGHVPNYAQFAAAETAVKRVKGVRAIAQDIEVRFADVSGNSDDEIAARALSMLEWSVLLPKDAVQVKVTKGWLTLTGDVAWHYQRTAAQDAVRGLAGVKGVSNLIAVKPTVRAGDVTRNIENALKRDALIDAQNIKVTVIDGKVKLEGKVHSWHEREAAERAAWAAPGVRSVDDLVAIA